MGKRFIVKHAAAAPKTADPPKLSKAQQLAAEGRRWVSFVVPVAVWDRFVAERCAAEKPSVVVNRMIAEAVDGEGEVQ